MTVGKDMFLKVEGLSLSLSLSLVVSFTLLSQFHALGIVF